MQVILHKLYIYYVNYYNENILL